MKSLIGCLPKSLAAFAVRQTGLDDAFAPADLAIERIAFPEYVIRGQVGCNVRDFMEVFYDPPGIVHQPRCPLFS